MKRIALLALVVVALTGARRRAIEVTPPPVAALRAERSFAITDKAILDGFALERVLAAMIARSSVPSTTPEQFFRQMFDTQNPKPGLDASMPHCDDVVVNGKASHNGYPRRCPTPEGALAREPFRFDEFVPLAIVNRFDMTDASGATCGQYRIVFARNTSGPGELLNLIFEGGLKNPHPEAGLGGCRPIAQFWAGLSAIDSSAERRARLEAFFYDGVAGFAPLIHPDHFRNAPHGIRNMHFKSSISPRFYQFRVVNECADGACRLFAKPDVLENFPSSLLLDVHDSSDRAVRFRDLVVDQIKTLTVRDTNQFFMTVPDEFLMAESDPGDGSVHFLWGIGFGRGSNTIQGRAYRDRLVTAIREAGSEARVEELFERATIMNCEGCHAVAAPSDVGDGVTFPVAGPNQQHVARTPAGTSLSPAMREVFIPNRMRILTEFLKSGKAPERSQ
jgi:hypothetical protein